ncbi:beta-1,4-galactosyltransferase 1-like [Physella acuta]|uniref:beta-1,4-galactosyltransferase 1-like n=1 Tax=Physella acuta TaxID=109671 RepID=UPI0027DB05D1|nr:beta-1,4-galactosyltransferase 1-like [Physella acuta]
MFQIAALKRVKRIYLLLVIVVCVVLNVVTFSPESWPSLNGLLWTPQIDSVNDPFFTYDYESLTLYENDSWVNSFRLDSGSLTLGQKTPLCPRLPPRLVGHIKPNTSEVTIEALAAMFPEVTKGGRLSPSGCQPRQKVAFVFPYRRRWGHLKIVLKNLIPILIRQQADVQFFVIEQAEGSTFNRGALLNVGFLEALKVRDFDCFIFHDVDLIPLSDKNLYRCGDNPRHFALALNKYSYSIYYKAYFGGVIGFSKEQFLDVNGNSNVYVGWGGEDDDLLERSLNKGYYISRYGLGIAKYDMISHGRDRGNEMNPHRLDALKNARERQDIEGLNTLTYKVLTKKAHQLFTWITVEINNQVLVQLEKLYGSNSKKKSKLKS